MSRTYGNFTDFVDFSRNSGGTALRRVSYGPELASSNPSDWTLGSGVSFDGTTFTVDETAGSNSFTNQVITDLVTPGEVYIASATVSNYVDGSVILRISHGGGVTNILDAVTEDGFISGTIVMPASSTLKLQIRCNANSTLDVSNVSFKKVTFDQPSGDLVLFNHPDDIPRVEYDANGTVKGLLIEEARTNLVPYSEDFTYLYESSLVFNYGVSSPTGGLNASVYSPTASSSNAISPINLNLSTGSYSASVWAKGVGASVGKTFRMWFWHLSSTGDRGIQTFTLTDEWQRFSILGTVTTTGDTRLRIDLTDHQDDFHVFGLQLEQGSFPTSYIPTTGSTKTRSADIASIDVDNFGYNKAAGTVVVEFQADDFTSEQQYILGTNTGSARWAYSNSGTTDIYNYDGSGSAFGSGYTAGVASKIASSSNQENKSFVIDGGSVSTVSTNGNIPSLTTTFSLGGQTAATSTNLNGHIKSVKYLPRKLTSTQLQEQTA